MTTQAPNPATADQGTPRGRPAADELIQRPFFWPAALPWTAWGVTLGFVAALTLIRLITVFTTFINLGPEEAQYWSWSQTFEFGYFSKPPMIAWLIGLTTIFSDSEGFVRLGAPLVHGATALVVFQLAKTLYSERVGLWSAMTFATLPGVVLSSVIITTDVPLLCAWATALLAVERTVSHHSLGNKDAALKWALIAGAAIGLGLLSKYAMSFFVLCSAFYVVFSPEARRAFFSQAGLAAAALATILFAPNLIWNAMSDFATVSHTAANGNWKGNLFNPEKLGDFLAGQISVFGPIPALAFMFGLVTLSKKLNSPFRQADIFLLCFSLPVLALIMGQAYISRANANWAAVAFVAATIVTVAWLLRDGGRWGKRLLFFSLVISSIALAILHACATVPGAIELLSRERDFKSARGWDELGNQIAVHVEAEQSGTPYTAIMSADRLLVSELTYYTRQTGLPVLMWDADAIPQNHFEQKAPFTPDWAGPVLFIGIAKNDRGEDLTRYQKVASNFARAETVHTTTIAKGGKISATYKFMRVEDFKKTMTDAEAKN